MKNKLIVLLGICFMISCHGFSQEYILPLDHNLQKNIPYKKQVLKPTANTLPFFEDFTDYSLFPNPAKWVDHAVYLNNTMGNNVISRGVATFDALNDKGGPYDSVNSNALIYADSLTSQPFDLSSHLPSDSLYISFFYQPQGNGFSPESQDSLMFFLKKKNNSWMQVWAAEGTTLQPFKQVMIPVADTSFLHNNFQFRFVNKASINVNDDVWNVDYIRFDAFRNRYDTAISDIATSAPPSAILNDYTFMPYRQFAADMNKELATQHDFTVKNNTHNNQAVSIGYMAREAFSNTSLGSVTGSSGNVNAYGTQQFSFPMYSINYTPSNPYDKVVLENKYFINTGLSQPTENDSIIHEQIFDNYLAYDDGTAEKSYFLKQFATLPAKIAIEHHLNQADTLRGMAVYFGRQVPLAINKFFNAQVYLDIAINGGSDNMIYDEDLIFPAYVDTVNKFWVYKFDQPVALNAGTFYISIMQPASSGSDSLYYGLDVNRVGGNHVYYNVLNYWQSSTVNGAVMIRPVIGKDITGTTGAHEMAIPDKNHFNIYPNPAENKLYVTLHKPQNTFYQICDINGKVILTGQLKPTSSIDISGLVSGTYFIKIYHQQKAFASKKFIKL